MTETPRDGLAPPVPDEGDPLPEARALIERRMRPRYRSLRQLSVAIGLPEIEKKLRSAADSRRLPRTEYLTKISEGTGISMGELVIACAMDAGFELPYEATAEDVDTIVEYLTSTVDQKKVFRAFMGWLKSDGPMRLPK